MRLFSLVIVMIFLLAPLQAEPEKHHDHQGHPQGHKHNHDFSDAEKWIEKFEDPARDEWQKPDMVVEKLDLKPGMNVADIGAASDWMEVHPLMTEPFVAAVPTGAVDSSGDVAAQLQKLPLIQYTQRHLMGRIIADHLARQNLRLSHRFELDSYHAIMALVAEGAGWTILTPLGLGRAHRFQGRAEILPLPFAPLSRTISLDARAGVLGAMPARMAGKLRPLIDELVVQPTVARLPWLEGALRVL